MLRSLAESLGLFLLPFAVFAIYLALRARWPLALEHWTRSRVATLIALGLTAALLSLAGASLFAPRGQGVYVPAHIVNGVLVPGHIE
jgi:uncharacterized protein DUF6111